MKVAQQLQDPNIVPDIARHKIYNVTSQSFSTFNTEQNAALSVSCYYVYRLDIPHTSLHLDAV